MVDIVTPQVEASGSPPEGHDAAMIAKVDALDKALQEEQIGRASCRERV